MRKESNEAKKKWILWILAGLIGVVILGFAGVSCFIGNQIVRQTTQLVTNEKTKDVHQAFWKEKNFDIDAFSKEYKIEKLELPSTKGEHKIPADFIYKDSKDKNLVIIIHGLGGNRKTNYPIAQLFLENGYNVLTYDQRSSGENQALKTTFGYLEKYDLIDYIRYMREQHPNIRIGVWGESFGGATAVHGVAFDYIQNEVSFMILDCPASSMEELIKKELSQIQTGGLPMDYMLAYGSMVNKLKLGFFYDDADAAKLAAKIQIPTLVINTKIDKVTPYFMGKDIYDHLGSKDKEIWTLENSPHIGAWWDENANYREKVESLIQRS